jgi:hypothetical protein
MEIVNSILMPFLILIFFSIAVTEHSSNFMGASRTFKVFLQLLFLISFIGILTILILIGIKTQWWIPIVLAVGSITICNLLRNILLGFIGLERPYILSLIAFLAIPITLTIILIKIF